MKKTAKPSGSLLFLSMCLLLVASTNAALCAAYQGVAVIISATFALIATLEAAVCWQQYFSQRDAYKAWQARQISPIDDSKKEKEKE